MGHVAEGSKRLTEMLEFSECGPGNGGLTPIHRPTRKFWMILLFETQLRIQSGGILVWRMEMRRGLNFLLKTQSGLPLAEIKRGSGGIFLYPCLLGAGIDGAALFMKTSVDFGSLLKIGYGLTHPNPGISVGMTWVEILTSW
jgi:hypothetical protein